MGNRGVDGFAAACGGSAPPLHVSSVPIYHSHTLGARVRVYSHGSNTDCSSSPAAISNPYATAPAAVSDTPRDTRASGRQAHSAT
jgi:hypothetical protein